MTLLPVAVGIGMAVSLLLTEAFGLATGGLVVPGYVALLIDRPPELALLLCAALLAYLAVKAMGSVAIVYGRRRTTITLLLGYLAHMGLRYAALTTLPAELTSSLGVEQAVGLIVPGLLALWLARQGVLETGAALCAAAAITRLALVVLAGEALTP